MDWQQQADESLEVLRRNGDTEVYRHFLIWMNAHLEQCRYELSTAQNDDAVMWLHHRAVLFNDLLSELNHE